MSRRHVLLLILAAGLTGCAAQGLFRSESASEVVARGQSPAPPQPQPLQPQSPGAAAAAKPLSLRDVIRISLQNSNVILTLSGDVALSGITSLDPQIAAAVVGQEEGRFNPRLASGVSSSSVNDPPSSFFGPGISMNTRYDQGTFYTRLAQPLTTGGEISAGYDPSTGYFFLPNGASSGQFNPAYTADFFFRLKQPLLKNGGTAKNLTGIRVARARADQTQWDLQSALNSQIRSLSEAYWDLLAARIRLQAIDSVIPLAKESVRLEQLRYEAEQVILADVARAEVQVEQLTRERASAVLEFRRRNYQLNQLMGVPTVVAGEIIPVDVPVSDMIPADASQMSAVALTRLPELARLRKQLEIRSLQLNYAYKDRLPDVNLLGEYHTAGLSNNLSDALSQSSTLGFPTWTMGVTFEYPLGNRTARSRAAAAEMELTRDQLVLRTSEERASYNISKLVAALEAAWERHQSADRQVQQSQEWLRLSGIRYKNPLPASRGGNWLLLALVDYQNAMRGYVDAVSAAADTLAEYNVALARLDEAQGISMDRWSIEMAEDASRTYCPEPPISGSAFAAMKKESKSSSAVKQAEYQADARPASRGASTPVPSSPVQQAAWQGHSSYRYQHLPPTTPRSGR